MTILAVANQKGGVGKTTTAVNLAASLAAAEHKVLLVDLDPQGNATSAFGVEKGQMDRHIYHVLVEERPLDSVLISTELAFLTLAPADTDLAGAEVELVGAIGRETRLRAAFDGLSARYDWIVIDCPPSLSLLTLNALTAADQVLIPLQAEFYALEGMSHLMGTLELVRTHLNPTLELEGIVLTMFDKRNRLSFQVRDEVLGYFGEQLYDTVVPRNVRLSESPSFGKPALLYDITAAGTKAYLALAEELLSRAARRTSGASFAAPPTPALAEAS